MSCLRTKDILFGGDGSDILGTLTDKGQNRLYGGEIRYPICWRQRQAIWGKGRYLVRWQWRQYLNRRDGKDLFVIAAAEIPDSATQLATSKRVLMLLG